MEVSDEFRRENIEHASQKEKQTYSFGVISLRNPSERNAHGIGRNISNLYKFALGRVEIGVRAFERIAER